MLPAAISSMSQKGAERLRDTIEADGFCDGVIKMTRVSMCLHFAALAKTFPAEMARRGKAGKSAGRLQGAMENICTPRNLELLLNGPRALARLPAATQQLCSRGWCASTSCEGTAAQIMSHFSNARQQYNSHVVMKLAAFSTGRAIVASAHGAGPAFVALGFREKLRRIAGACAGGLFAKMPPLAVEEESRPRFAEDSVGPLARLPRRRTASKLSVRAARGAANATNAARQAGVAGVEKMAKPKAKMMKKSMKSKAKMAKKTRKPKAKLVKKPTKSTRKKLGAKGAALPRKKGEGPRLECEKRGAEFATKEACSRHRKKCYAGTLRKDKIQWRGPRS